MKKCTRSGLVTAHLTAVGLALLLSPAGKATPYVVDLTRVDPDPVINATYDVGSTNGAIFSRTQQHPTGTGVIDSFLRIQNNDSENGLNSNEDNSNVLGNTKTGLFTHDLTLADVGKVSLATGDYYAFLLDINQQKSHEMLSLDTLRLYTSAASISDGLPDTEAAILAKGGVLRFDMDFDSELSVDNDSTVYMKYGLNSGSGGGDVWVYVPVLDFGSAAATDYLYLYSEFGMTGGAYKSNDGQEEWAALKPSTLVPDGGATLLLLGLGLLALPFGRRAVKA